jgi:hypothetical protein
MHNHLVEPGVEGCEVSSQGPILFNFIFKVEFFALVHPKWLLHFHVYFGFHLSAIVNI